MVEVMVGGATEACLAGGAAAADEFGWQASCGGLSERLGCVLARGLWPDCEVLVGAARSPARAHRVLLAAASPVLAAMLYGPLAAPGPDHKPLLPDLDIDTFQLLLQYMYTDNITISSSEVACKLYKAAHYLILPHVQMVSKTFLLNNLPTESELDKVLSIYEFGELYDDKEIMDKCLELMSKETAAVLERVENIRAETLRRVFALPTLAVASELDLVRAAERWLRARRPASPVASLQENGANLGMGEAQPLVSDCDDDTRPKTAECEGLEHGNDPKMLIRDAVKEIRFLAMEPKEFASHDMSALLTKSEGYAILLNLVSDESHMAMPDGFSLSKEKRIRKIYEFTVKVDKKSNHIISEEHIIQDFPCDMEFTNVSNNIYICCNREKWNTLGWFCDANIKVEVLSQKTGVPNKLVKDRHKFKPGYGFYLCKTLNWGHLRDSANGYVNDGKVTFEVTIDVVASSQ